MDLWELFIVALMPNLKMLLITAAGSLLALDRFDILGNTASKNLNTVSFTGMFQCLLAHQLNYVIVTSFVSVFFLVLTLTVDSKEG